MSSRNYENTNIRKLISISSENSYYDGYSVCSASASMPLPNSPQPKSPKSAETFLSPIEEAILRSNIPIEINEIEEITALGERGIWANKSESISWKGFYNLDDYPLNEDTEPEIITKKVSQQLEYVQELAYRYLQPPTPPLPGEIIIRQEANTITPPAPPLIIRQQPPRPGTPEPLVIREAPPQPPPAVGRKIITISGTQLPPPPRKVIIERLAPIPSKPQAVVIERWLPYTKPKRRVIFQSAPQDPVVVKPKNIIVQWDAPNVVIKQEVKHLGVIKADPVDYYNKYGQTLTHSSELPQFVIDIKPPEGISLAANHLSKSYELEGDVEALNLIDLDREGLGEYKAQLNIKSKTSSRSSAKVSTSSSPGVKSPNSYQSSHISSSAFSIIDSIFNEVENDGEISINEAEHIFSRLNERSGKSFKKDELKKFIKLNFNDKPQQVDEKINLNDFRNAFKHFTREL